MPSRPPMAEHKVKAEPGPPMTLGNAAAARVRLIVWCKDCQHQVEPDPAEMAQRYGAATRCSIGAPGSYAPAAAAVKSIWWLLASAGSGRRLIRAEAESSCEN